MTHLVLPKYVCHKIVQAAKLSAIDPVGASVSIEGSDVPIEVGRPWLERHKPEAGGYFVQYEDGYSSFSPADAFESGYTMAADLSWDASRHPSPVVVDHIHPGPYASQFRIIGRGATTGGVYANYLIEPVNGNALGITLQFQTLPWQEGTNGVTDEALLGIISHRLRCLQAGPFHCSQNKAALGHVLGALHHLNLRQLDRMKRGVEGKCEP